MRGMTIRELNDVGNAEFGGESFSANRNGTRVRHWTVFRRSWGRQAPAETQYAWRQRVTVQGRI